MNEKPAWLRELFPWAQKTVRVNGRSMAYVDDADLVDFCLWFAETVDGLEREDIERVFERAGRRPA